MFLTDHRSPMSSPWSSVTTAFSQNSTRIATLVHLMSSIYVLFLHVLNEYAYSLDDPKLSLFVKSRYASYIPCIPESIIHKPATQEAPSLSKRPPPFPSFYAVIHRLLLCVSWDIDGSICLPLGGSGTYYPWSLFASRLLIYFADDFHQKLDCPHNRYDILCFAVLCWPGSNRRIGFLWRRPRSATHSLRHSIFLHLPSTVHSPFPQGFLDCRPLLLSYQFGGSGVFPIVQHLLGLGNNGQSI